MTTLQTSEFDSVLDIVRSWPPAQRLTLAQHILETLERDVSVPSAQRKSLQNLLGLIKLAGPPPTDEECEKMLEEELLRKYGP